MISGSNKKNTRQGNVFCSKHTCVQWYSRCGSVAGTWLSQEEGRKSRKLKALMTGPSGRDHKLSQLAAERLVLNSDPACCPFVYREISFCSLSPVWHILCCLQLTITQASVAGQGHKWSNYNFTSAFWHLEERDRRRREYLARKKYESTFASRHLSDLKTFHLWTPEPLLYWHAVDCTMLSQFRIF